MLHSQRISFNHRRSEFVTRGKLPKYYAKRNKPDKQMVVGRFYLYEVSRLSQFTETERVREVTQRRLSLTDVHGA